MDHNEQTRQLLELEDRARTLRMRQPQTADGPTQPQTAYGPTVYTHTPYVPFAAPATYGAPMNAYASPYAYTAPAFAAPAFDPAQHPHQNVFLAPCLGIRLSFWCGPSSPTRPAGLTSKKRHSIRHLLDEGHLGQRKLPGLSQRDPGKAFPISFRVRAGTSQACFPIPTPQFPLPLQ